MKAAVIVFAAPREYRCALKPLVAATANARRFPGGNATEDIEYNILLDFIATKPLLPP
jgi:hypothetical protein